MPDRSRLIRRVGLGAVLLLAAACGGRGDAVIPDDAFPIIANADLAVGEHTLLVGLVTPEAESLATPDLEVEIDLYAPKSVEPTLTVPGTFIWTVTDVRGLYRAQVDFDQAGAWQVAIRAGDQAPTQPVPFNVAEETMAPSPGDPAPPVVTRTSVGADLTSISTDPDPDPRFYELSLDEAVSSGTPTVVVFATPGFCETATCGPMLDTVKQVAVDYPELNFVHVEIYQDLNVQSRDQLQVVEAVEAWGLPSEPWVFVVDSEGIVSARFEGTVELEELESALDGLG